MSPWLSFNRCFILRKAMIKSIINKKALHDRLFTFGLPSYHSSRNLNRSRTLVTLTQSDLIAEIEQARSRKDIFKLIELCQQLKDSHQPLPEDLIPVYGHLISLFGYYGLWSQLYAIFNEFIDTIPLENVDDATWSAILDGFIDSGKSTDIVLLHIFSTGKDLQASALASLFRGAIIEQNFSQCLFLLKQAISSSLLNQINKPILTRLSSFLAQHGENRLAMDLTHSYVVPILDSDHPICLENLLDLLRHCVDRSDPESTLYFYSYLSKHHQNFIDQNLDDGLLLGLISMAHRHVLPELSINVISQLIRSQRKLEFVHLFLSVTTLCRAGNRMKDVMEILMRMDKHEIGTDEAQVISFNLILGHLGGLHHYRTFLSQHDPLQETKQIAKGALTTSKQFCEDILKRYKDHSQDDRSYMSLILINSLIQADMEIGEPSDAIQTYKKYYDSTPPLFSPNSHAHSLLEDALKKMPNNDNESDG
ncbi:hypothetical protein O181_022864 [Austropuccinia psidii MF-1]|uniref:Pentatricopeptide repeat-containing protein-mitochondrial domain-containing protein n=1 Tax=Austropuccinia psidii MF-1 TaxID=1389203 RepID=A0A9Q3CDE7_9BASI|nr:hypothetical protein [Austropuccinia psidii MF-1]